MGRVAATPAGDLQSWVGSSLELVESKLHPPPARPGIVPRTGLVERLLASDVVPVVCVVAPAGYGKTTLLAQWAQRTAHRVGWVSVDQRDNDPAVLLTYLAVALDRVEPIDPRIVRGLAGPGASIVGAVPRLAAAMAAMTRPVALVLDHLELLENQECLDVVAELAAQLPAGAQLLVASRARPPLPVALLRAQGRVVELGVEDLAMDDQEARALLEGAGVGLDDAEVNELLARTEGWPVGLYLAALAHKAGGPRRHAWAGFTGDDRFMADYLWSELLGQLPPELVAFLTRTAVLDRMSGPLCDAVLDTTGSAMSSRRWRRPTCCWSPSTASAGGTATTTCSMSCSAPSWTGVSPNWSRSCMLGRRPGVRPTGCRRPRSTTPRPPGTPTGSPGWSGSWPCPPTAPGGSTPPAAGSAGSRTRGCSDATRRWPCSGPGCRPWSVSRPRPSAGPTRPNTGRLPGRSRTAAPARATWRCCGRCCAATAWTGCGPTPRPPWPSSSPGSQWRPTAQLLEGICYLLAGQADRADPVLAHAVEVATEAGALPAAAIALAERSLVAMDQQDWKQAATLAEQASGVVRAGGLDGYVASALVHAVAARVAVHQGDVRQAQQQLARATRLRPLLTYALPYFAVQTLLELGRACLALDDAAGARVVLRQARDILRRRPDLGILPAQVEELWSKLDTSRGGTVGVSR